MLGDALDRKAIHGGKAKTDKIDAHKIAVLFRGGILPQANVYPKRMRETRGLLRRRTFLVRRRAEALVHLSATNRQYNQPPVVGHYVRAAELKAAGLNWTEVLDSALHSSTNARARVFVAQGGGFRAISFNHRRRLVAIPTEDES
jgi:hypothetical protein